MPVKHWSHAGLLLTYWCGARCASCYVCSGESAGGEMTVAFALELWAGLAAASPHGCRIHVGGGEPFGRWERLIELARAGRSAGLGGLQAVETNAFWATGRAVVRDRLRALDAAGLGRLVISADPYHQQFVPIERVRLATAVAEEVLGAARIRVRWRDWAEGGFDTAGLSPQRRAEVFAEYARRGRDRIAGRAAEQLADLLPLMPPERFADEGCGEWLGRCRHVHADGEGVLCPGTCAGIILGRATGADSVGRIWREVDAALSRGVGEAPAGGEPGGSGDVLTVLAAGGPAGLMRRAAALGYAPRPQGYAAKCHLCWHVRRWLFDSGRHLDRLGPAQVYRP
jgi:hypothetical protein